MSRPSKRLRTESCLCWMDCTSLTKVPAPHLIDSGVDRDPPIVQTKLASKVTKEIFLDRLRKEVVDRFDFSLKSQMEIRHGDSVQNVKERRHLIKERLLVGMSVCTKGLLRHDAAATTPSFDLLVVCSDFSPTHFAVHLPILALERQIPLLLLPNASMELGALLGVRCAGVLAFRTAAGHPIGEAKEIHGALDSFVGFVKSQLV